MPKESFNSISPQNISLPFTQSSRQKFEQTIIYAFWEATSQIKRVGEEHSTLISKMAVKEEVATRLLSEFSLHRK